jgi:hypothetical protein
MALGLKASSQRSSKRRCAVENQESEGTSGHSRYRWSVLSIAILVVARSSSPKRLFIGKDFPPYCVNKATLFPLRLVGGEIVAVTINALTGGARFATGRSWSFE